MDILNELYEKNPYDGFSEDLKLDIQGWGTNKSTLNGLIDEIKPYLIIEVGTWKGQSAINMANHVKKTGMDCKIVCVDTWLGSLEHIRTMPLKNGYSTLYYQFLFNVKETENTDIIIPFPNTSAVAFQWFEKNNIKADIVYIDGSHNYEDVYYDITHYYKLVRGGGILCGDDFKWRGVEMAVNHFCNYDDGKYELLNDGVVWVIRK